MAAEEAFCAACWADLAAVAALEAEAPLAAEAALVAALDALLAAVRATPAAEAALLAALRFMLLTIAPPRRRREEELRRRDLPGILYIYFTKKILNKFKKKTIAKIGTTYITKFCRSTANTFYPLF
jgi:hypothetical protein